MPTNKLLLYLFFLGSIVAFTNSCSKKSSPAPPVPIEPIDSGDIVVPKLVETEPPILTPKSDSISENITGYYETIPARYHESRERYPTIIDFHGGGQYGDGSTDLHKVLRAGIPKLISQNQFPPSFTVDGERFSFIVIAPQLKKEVANAEVLNLLNYVVKHYNVDLKRLYITGFSLGGQTAANYAALRPEKFAALITFGGLPGINSELALKCETMARAKLPVWHFHNRDDTAWAYSQAEEYIRMFNSFSPEIPPRFTTFDIGEGKNHHDCWTRTTDPAYKEDGLNIYEWLLKHKREQ